MNSMVMFHSFLLTFTRPGIDIDILGILIIYELGLQLGSEVGRSMVKKAHILG